MRFLDVGINVMYCYLNGFDIFYTSIQLLDTPNSVIICLITVPDCGLPNGTKLSYLKEF